MPQDPITWQAAATLVGLLFTAALLLVNIRAQFRAAQEQIDRRFAEAQTRSDERARRTLYGALIVKRVFGRYSV